MISFVAAALSLAVPGGQQSPDRDQFGPLARVHRLTFEDRTRMVLFDGGQGLWLAFNPATCALQKAWSGEVDWRGKVYDFSMDNSRAKGEVIYEAPSVLAKLEDGKLTEGWVADRVEWKDGWVFSGEGASLTSPSIDSNYFINTFVKFDETSRKGPIRVYVEESHSRPQSFNSTTHGSSQTAWQFNFKQISLAPIHNYIHFVQDDAAFEKKLRGITVFGDKTAWYLQSPTGARVPAVVNWRGYELVKTGQTMSVRMLYNVHAINGKVLPVTHLFTPTGPKMWREEIQVQGMTAETPLYILRDAPNYASLKRDGKWINITTDQPVEIEFNGGLPR